MSFEIFKRNNGHFSDDVWSLNGARVQVRHQAFDSELEVQFELGSAIVGPTRVDCLHLCAIVVNEGASADEEEVAELLDRALESWGGTASSGYAGSPFQIGTMRRAAFYLVPLANVLGRALSAEDLPEVVRRALEGAEYSLRPPIVTYEAMVTFHAPAGLDRPALIEELLGDVESSSFEEVDRQVGEIRLASPAEN